MKVFETDVYATILIKIRSGVRLPHCGLFFAFVDSSDYFANEFAAVKEL